MKHLNLLAIILLFCIALLIYSNSYNVPFILDDGHVIAANSLITDFKYAPLFFKGYTTSYPLKKGMFRPLLMVTFTLNYLTSKLSPQGYHFINIIFHALNSLLLFFLLKKLSAKKAPIQIILITLLFVIHPINTEAVTYISSRSDLMVTFLMLSSLLSLLNQKHTLSAFLYALSLTTKETALCLPIIIAGYYLFYYKNLLSKKILDRKKIAIFLSSISIITLIYLSFRSIYFDPLTPGDTRSLDKNFLLQSWVTFFYLKLFFWPNNINILHAYPEPLALSNPIFIISSLGFLILFILIILFRKNHTLLGFGLFFYTAALLPKFYSTLKLPVAEHHFYVPSIGIYIILFFIVNKYIKHKRIFIYSAIPILLILSTITYERNIQLQSPVKTWEYGVRKEPLHSGNWIYLAIAYKNSGDFENAKKTFLKANNMKLSKEFRILIATNLANILFQEKHYERALEILDVSLKMESKTSQLFEIYNAMALINYSLKNTDKAIELLEKARQISPLSQKLYMNLGKIYLEQNNISLADEYLHKSRDLNPADFYTYFLLGVLFEKKGNLNKAVQNYRESVQLKSDWFQTHYYLALLYKKLNDQRFHKEIQEALRLNPGFKPALSLIN